VSTAPGPAAVRRTGTRRLVISLLALATAGALSACGAGLDAHTYEQRNSADASSAQVGDLSVRNVAVEAPRNDRVYEVGDDARVTITVTNSGQDDDRLVEVTSSAAQEVAVMAGREERDLVVPASGSTGDFVTLELRGLTRPLRAGEFIDLTLRFADNGSVQVLAPVSTTGDTDRPVYTGERFEGGEEPALQGPAGGDHGEGGHEDEGEHEDSGGKGGESAAG
jgi:copper(I)-binding protein